MSRQFYCIGHCCEVFLHQHHVGGIYCHVSACADCNANLCNGQSKCVVYAVTDHCHCPLFLQLSYHLFLAVRKDSCHHFINADFLGDCLCSALVVPCQHNSFHSHFVKVFHRFDCVFFDDVRNGYDTFQHSVCHKVHRCFALFRKGFRHCFHVFGDCAD